MKVLLTKRIHRVEIQGRDLWSLDHTLAQIIAPALKRFKQASTGTPGSFCYEGERQISGKQADAKWRAVLDKMIYAFEAIAKDDWPCGPAGSPSAKKHDRIQEGLSLFAQYYGALWN